MAPRRGARVVKVDNIIDYDNLTVKEVLCPICRSILIEPVTLPCNHVFCSACFQGTMENANLVCPLCRVRIGSWLRSSKKENKLINIDYWNAIKKLFPVQIKNKLEGIEENLDYEAPLIRLAQPGELKREYENQIQRETETMRREREAQSKASEELIKKLREEEEYQKVLEEEKLRLDEEIARKLAQELNQVIVDNKSEEQGQSQLSMKKATENHNNVKKVGPLDRFLKAKKMNNSDSSIKTHKPKTNFSKKEYTCRILCQEIENEKKVSSQKEEVDSKITSSNKLSKKISGELEQAIEVEGNSDSSDSIDSEYRFFKPVDYRRNPPCQKTTPVKVPTVKLKGAIPVQISAPQGKNVLQLTPGISAFARFHTTPVEIRDEEVDEQTVSSKRLVNRRKSGSPEKKNTSPKIKSVSCEKHSKVSLLKSPQRKNNNTINCVNNSNRFASSPKRNCLNKSIVQEATNSVPKRKLSDSHIDDISPKKKDKTDTDISLSRLVSTPSSPFRGFVSTNIIDKMSHAKVLQKSPRIKVQQSKLKVSDEESERKKNKLQEQADYELALKLQSQFDSFTTLTTRNSTLRKGIKVTRQTTLDSIVSKKSYKV